ncbi:MAG: M23 family metallopeptidase [Candidatus Aenigmarchaeota archaeon]|nr:M23 family metallopeptidase [Candidatus Aenigmarchaeota archaeon]
MPPKDLDGPGLIEETVKDARLVDSGLLVLRRYIYNTPSFEPDRRRFLKYAAGLAGLSIGLSGCAQDNDRYTRHIEERDWRSFLLKQDLINGPPVHISVVTGVPNDFEGHLSHKDSNGFGAIDYRVPSNTPITPTASGRIAIAAHTRIGGIEQYITHSSAGRLYRSGYVHLSSTIKVRPGEEVDLSSIISFSGYTGYGPGGMMPEHLHFMIYERRHDGTYVERNGKQLKWHIHVRPGLDPFILGVSGRRPIYWDTRTIIYDLPDRKRVLDLRIDELESRINNSELDNQAKSEILRRRHTPLELRGYLVSEVLTKAKDGKYKCLPGSDMYSLMLDFLHLTSKNPFIAMLPFPHPMLLDFYKKGNPNVQL